MKFFTSISLSILVSIQLYTHVCFIDALVPRGTSDKFALLASTSIVNTGITDISGSIGLYPGTSLDQEGVVQSSGSVQLTSPIASQAQIDATTAYNFLSTRLVTMDLSGQNLQGMTLTPGVFFFSESAQLSGLLILDYEGNTNAEFIFQVTDNLVIDSIGVVTTINSGSTNGGCNVFWKVGNSATLVTNSVFLGNLISQGLINMQTGSTVVGGSLISRSSSITLNTNSISNCVNTAPTEEPAAGGVGDPVFTGLQGQEYQVHGEANTYFNIITSLELNLNSKFVYLESGICNYNNTVCFTHPGTYFGEFGIVLNNNDTKRDALIKMHIISRSHDLGLKVIINNKTIKPKSSPIQLSATSILRFTSSKEIVIETPRFVLILTNSDSFINFGVMLLDKELLRIGKTARYNKNIIKALPKTRLVHGLLGQTWLDITYPNKYIKYIDGEVGDYIVETVFDTSCKHNLF